MVTFADLSRISYVVVTGAVNVAKHIGFLKGGHLNNEFNEGATAQCNIMQFFCTEGPNGHFENQGKS